MSPPIDNQVLSSPGRPLPDRERAFFEPRIGHNFGEVRVNDSSTPSGPVPVNSPDDHLERDADRQVKAIEQSPTPKAGPRHDFSQVRIHTDNLAAESALAVNARAYTFGRNIVFGAGEYSPSTTEGKRLLGHELAHVVQQAPPSLRRQQAATFGQEFTSPLSNSEWVKVKVWQSLGEANFEPLTGDPHYNARVVASAIFCDRALSTLVSRKTEDPLLCLDPAVTHADPRVLALIPKVTVRGSIIAPIQEQFSRDLTDNEWDQIKEWQTVGQVEGRVPLTGDAEHNASVIASALFCRRALSTLALKNDEDPLLCIIDDVTLSDPRVRTLVSKVTARGSIIHWPSVPAGARILYVMNQLVERYKFPVNGAAGLLGNLFAESGIIPSRIEGSAPETPMRANSSDGRVLNFTADEVMNRTGARSPSLPGVGLAQWTSAERRTGLFQFAGGSAILFSMDDQIAYLINEIQTKFPRVNAKITSAGCDLNTASDVVLRQFEAPRDVEGQVSVRRRSAQRALQIYNDAHR